MRMKYADGREIHDFFKALFGAWSAASAVEEAIHVASGLTGGQKKNLAHLVSGGTMTISDLAYVRKVSRQSVQVAINSLHELGYIELLDNPRHKQAKLIAVTRKGRTRLLEAEEAEHALIQQLFSHMDREQVIAAIELLNETRAILEDMPNNRTITQLLSNRS